MLSEPNGVAKSLERQTGLRVDIHGGRDLQMWVILGFDPDEQEASVMASGKSLKRARHRFQELNLARVRRLKMVEQKGRCRLCPSTGPLQLDHIKAKSKGRDDRPENTQLLCDPCHRRKTGTLHWSPRKTVPRELSTV